MAKQHRALRRATIGPDVSIELIGFGHVQHFLPVEPVKGEALRVGQTRQQRPLRGRLAADGMRDQLVDLAVGGVTDQQIAGRRPGFQTRRRNPGPHLGRPTVWQRQRAHSGQRPASIPGRDREGNLRKARGGAGGGAAVAGAVGL
jgi:hypothetical protein